MRVLTAVDYSSVPVWPGASTEYLRDVALERATAVADEGVSRALSVGPGCRRAASRPPGGAAGALVEASRQASLLVLGRAEHSAFTLSLARRQVQLTVIAHAVCPVVLVPTGPALPARTRPARRGRGGRLARGRLGRDVRGRPGGHLEGTAHGHLGLAGAGQRDVARAYWDAAPRDAGLHGAKRERAEQVVAEAVGMVQASQPDLDVAGQAVEGRAGQALAAASADAGIVVVGSRGHGGFTGMLLGSVSHAVLHAASGPVAVIQPKP